MLEKMTFLVDGHSPTTRTTFVRFRQNYPRHDLNFDILDQNAQD